MGMYSADQILATDVNERRNDAVRKRRIMLVNVLMLLSELSTTPFSSTNTCDDVNLEYCYNKILEQGQITKKKVTKI